eukprot:scaffold1222_cov317-Pavlova_lutheri.AAC.2
MAHTSASAIERRFARPGGLELYCLTVATLRRWLKSILLRTHPCFVRRLIPIRFVSAVSHAPLPVLSTGSHARTPPPLGLRCAAVPVVGCRIPSDTRSFRFLSRGSTDRAPRGPPGQPRDTPGGTRSRRNAS